MKKRRPALIELHGPSKQSTHSSGRGVGAAWEDPMWIGKKHLFGLGVGRRKGVHKGKPYEI